MTPTWLVSETGHNDDHLVHFHFFQSTTPTKSSHHGVYPWLPTSQMERRIRSSILHSFCPPYCICIRLCILGVITIRREYICMLAHLSYISLSEVPSDVSNPSFQVSPSDMVRFPPSLPWSSIGIHVISHHRHYMTILPTYSTWHPPLCSFGPAPSQPTLGPQTCPSNASVAVSKSSPPSNTSLDLSFTLKTTRRSPTTLQPGVTLIRCLFDKSGSSETLALSHP
jgi:hypothetical protein